VVLFEPGRLEAAVSGAVRTAQRDMHLDISLMLISRWPLADSGTTLQPSEAERHETS
jgi:hypothetical protein